MSPEENKVGVIIRTFATAYQGTIEEFNNTGKARGTFIRGQKENEYAQKGYRWKAGESLVRVIDSSYMDPNYAGTSLNYSSAGIQFQKDWITCANYTSGGSQMSYALQKKRFEVNKIGKETGIDLGTYTYQNNQTYNVSENNALTSDKIIRYNASGNKGKLAFQMYRWTVTNENIAVSDWFIPDEFIKNITKQGYIKDGKVRFSLYSSVLANCYEQFKDTGFYDDSNCNNALSDNFIFSKTIEAYMNFLVKKYGTDIIDSSKLPFSYDAKDICSSNYGDPKFNDNANIRKIAYNTKQAYDITVYGQGVGFNDGENGLRGISNSDRSIANDYDNWLILDDIIHIKKNVYIRHVDKDTNELLDIANENELVTKANGGTSLTAPNLKNKKPNGGSYTYSEAFTNLEADDRVIASRSTTLAKDGVKYKYYGVKIGKSSTISDAESKMNNCPYYSNQDVNDDTSSDEFVTITFYYTKDDTPIPDPKIYVGNNTLQGNDCKTTEVQSGGSIKPYIVTPTYTVKTLKYQKQYSNGKVTYTIKDFVINKLTSMNIVNSDGYNHKGKIISGKIITNTNERQALFNSSDANSINLVYDYSDLNSSISTQYNNIKNTANLSNINVDNIKGSNTKAENFKKTYNIIDNAYNGLRYIKGQTAYVDYNVLNSGSSNSRNVAAKNTQFVNVYNKINVSVGSVSSPNVVDHSTSDTQKRDYTIQKNAPFTITLNSENEKYLDKYFLIFDFDINYQNKEYKANTWIEVPVNKGKQTVFEAIPTSGGNEGDIVSQIENTLLVVGMSNNVPDGYRENVFTQFTQDKLHSIYNTTSTSGLIEHMQNITNEISRDNVCTTSKDVDVHTDKSFTGNTDLYEDIYYFAWTKAKFKTLSRIYDFKVTDCLDVNFKSVFRKSDDKNVNSLTEVQYFSGIKELKIYGASYNVLQSRDLSDTRNRTLPLGPYKHTDNSYIFAPKLGYRISFDLKTSGYYDYNKNDSGRKIIIKPSYYYISKDAKQFKDNINIYYKNSEGKYQKFVNSNYTIFFTPNDGYRYINNLGVTDNISNMSTKLTEINISSEDGFVLLPNMMATSDNNFIQSWYGEFKLPNSAIAVEGTKINSPLTDGYIGVKFEIICVDKIGSQEAKISYNQNNSKAANPTNTTQWDYEGYLGFNNPGSEAKDLKLQLEKGTWNIDNSMYQKIKGTVMLYDTDSRAAEDFN